MYRKMLVLLDGSKLAEVVFTYARELSARLNINLELLHVCSPLEAEQLPMHQVYIEHMAEMLQKQTEEMRSRIEGQISDPGVKARGKVVVGYPAEEILKYAEENNIDLIMLSSHGRSGIRAWGLGNVANKVIHASPVPVWLVPTELREEVIYDKLPVRAIVIPLNGSPMAEEVIPHAIAISKQRGAETEIILIHVETRKTSTMYYGDIQREQDEKMEATNYLNDVVKRIEGEGIQARAEILSGVPAEAIIDFVRDHPTQLIAMSTHGRAGLSKMIFSGITENVLNLVKKTPILLVKPQ